jgi:hypothetical protein
MMMKNKFYFIEAKDLLLAERMRDASGIEAPGVQKRRQIKWYGK